MLMIELVGLGCSRAASCLSMASCLRCLEAAMATALTMVERTVVVVWVRLWIVDVRFMVACLLSVVCFLPPNPA